MQAYIMEIDKFFSGSKVCFMIPVFQRNYDWNEENCKQLFNDIRALNSNAGNRTHFLGTICFKTINSREISVIDGQQRITSITLLMKAIHDCIGNNGIKEDIDDIYLHNNRHSIDESHRVKLHLNKRDNLIYNKLLESSPIDDSDNFTKNEQESRTYLNYLYFCNRLQKLDDAEMERMYNNMEFLNIVSLDVENENPQEIFESLNSTGLDLSSVDLIRNYLLMNLDHDTQSHLYEDYWYKIEENVGTDNMVRFFIDYLIYTKRSDSLNLNGRRAHINENNLYTGFKLYYNSVVEDNEESISSSEIIDSILNNMYERSKDYKQLVFRNDVDVDKLSEVERAIYSIVYTNESVSSRALLLYIMCKRNNGSITEIQAMEMINACLSLIFRSKISGTSGITGQFAGNVLQRLPDDGEDMTDIIKMFWISITSGEGKYSFPSDAAFRESLINRPLFDIMRAKGTRYLFYSLEKNSPYPKGLPRYDDTTTTVEHILPQHLSEEWQTYLGDDVSLHADNLHKIGNLSLTNYNPEMSNRTFDEKKSWYNQSNFYYTRILAEHHSWKIEDIHQRSKVLANKCLDIWKLSTEYHSDDKLEPVMRRSRFKFDMIGLSKGDEISFYTDPSKVAIVISGNKIEFENEEYSLSSLATKLTGRNSCNGPSYFRYKGEILSDMRERMENEEFDSSDIEDNH